MKKINALFGLATWLLFSLSGCQKEPVAPREPISCAYRVLNAKGEDATIFTQGQEIFFRYEVRNNTDQSIFLARDLFDYDRFMEVFRDANGQLQLLGKPYASLGQYYGGDYEVAPHGTFSYTFSWIESAPSSDAGLYTPAANQPLPPGHYRTSMVPHLTWHRATEPATTLALTPQDFVQVFEVRQP